MLVPDNNVPSRPRPCVRLRSNDRFARRWIRRADRRRCRLSVPQVAPRPSLDTPGLSRVCPGYVGVTVGSALRRVKRSLPVLPRAVEGLGVRLGIRKRTCSTWPNTGRSHSQGRVPASGCAPGACDTGRDGGPPGRKGGLLLLLPGMRQANPWRTRRPALRRPSAAGRAKVRGRRRQRGSVHRAGCAVRLCGRRSVGRSPPPAAVSQSSPKGGQRLPRRRRASAGVSGPSGEWRRRAPAFAGRTTTTGPGGPMTTSRPADLRRVR